MKPIGTLHPTEIPTASNTIQQAVLAAGTAQAFDVPTGGCIVAFGSDVNFWVSWGSTAASIPTTNSTGSSTNAEMNPLQRNIVSTAACTGYSVVSPSSGYLTASWYGR